MKLTAEHVERKDVLPEGTVVRLRYEEDSIREMPSRDGGTWEKLSVKFTILEVYDPNHKEWEGKTIWGGVSWRLTDDEDNKLRQWAEALYGFEIKAGFEIETNDWKTRQVKGITGQWKDGNGRDRHEVDSLLPLDAAGVKPAEEGSDQDSIPGFTVASSGVPDSEIPF